MDNGMIHLEHCNEHEHKLVDRRDYVVARASTRGTETRNEHQAVAWVGGGLLYSPTARALLPEPYCQSPYTGGSQDA